MIDQFPSSMDAYSAGCLHFALLSRLSQFLTFLAYPTRDDEPRELAVWSIDIDTAPRLLGELKLMLTNRTIPLVDNERSIAGSSLEQRYLDGIVSYSTSLAHSSISFRCLDVVIPDCLTEEQSLGGSILLKQRVILQVSVDHIGS